jgi:hypothetical protein
VEDLVKEVLSFIEASRSDGKMQQGSAANFRTIFRQMRRRNGFCCAPFMDSERKLTENW